MSIAGYFKNTVVALLTSVLVSSGLPAIAADEVEPRPSVSLEKNEPADYLGDISSHTLAMTADYTNLDNKSYRISLFDNFFGSKTFVGSCGIAEWDNRCFVDIPFEQSKIVGVHQYTAYLEESNSTGFAVEIDSFDDLEKVLSASKTLAWERRPLSVSSISNSPFVSRSPYATAEENYPHVRFKSNQLYSEDYTYYMFDLTNDKLIGSYISSAFTEWDQDVPDFKNGVSSFQTFLAKTADNVQSVNDLTDIKAVSNIVTKTRRPWSVELSSYPLLGVQVIAHPGGGDYTVYLEDKSTGEIFWTSQNLEASYDAGFRGHPDSTYDWARAYIAEPWDTNGSMPTSISQLVNIRTNSDLGPEKIDAPGMSGKEEAAGGFNPSEICKQLCSGDPINNYTGEFFDSETDLTAAGAGLTPSMTRNFSTQLKDEKNAMGYGWRHSYEIKIKSATAEPLATASRVKIIQENGSHTYFNREPDGSYTAPGRVHATLIKNSSGQFIFVRDKKDTFTFSTTGLLQNIKDINGNTLTVSYVNGRVSTVSDGIGNTLTFAYNTSGLVSTVTDQNARKSTYTYTSDKLTSVTNANNVVTNYTYDSSRRVKTLSNALGGITENIYDAENRVIEQIDPRSNSITFAYQDGQDGQMTTTITHPDGNVVQEYYASGLLFKKVEGYSSDFERTWQYSYDTDSNRISTINPDGSNVSSSYDGDGNMIKSRNTLGGESVFTYDALGNVLTAKNPLGDTTTYTYDTKSNLTSITSPLGAKTTFVWNANGTLNSTVDPRGNKLGGVPAQYKTEFSYNAKGLPVNTTDPLGNISTKGYDSLGRPVSQIDPKGNVSGTLPSDYTSTIAYNSLDLPQTITNQKGNQTVMTYDNAGNPLTVKDANNKITTNTYDTVGNLLTSKDSEGFTESYTYDADNRVAAFTDKRGKVTTYAYDVHDRIISITDPLNHNVFSTYDSMDRVISVTDGAGKVTTSGYDSEGNKTTVKDTLGNSAYSQFNNANQLMFTIDAEGKTTSYEYNKDGLLTKTINPDSSFSTFVYDESGNMTSRINANNKTETWTYDTLNRKTSYKDAENQTESYVYDANSNLKEITRRDGTKVISSFDRANLIIGRDYPGTASDLVYTYDALGRVLTESRNGLVTTNTYDSIGRLKTRGTPGKVVSYGYDPNGNNTSLTYPSGRNATYTYDDAENMTALSTTGISPITFGYDARNLPTTANLPNGAVETRTIDELGRQTGLTVENSTTVLYKNTKTYTEAGNLSSSSISNGAVSPVEETYSHDAMNRTTNNTSSLTGASGAYAYDTAGVLKSLEGQAITVNNIGKPLTVGTKTLGYNTLGQRTSETIAGSATRSMTWNTEGTLATVSAGPNGNTAAGYSYTADGLLSSKTAGTDTNSFIWDSTAENALMLSDGDYEYVYGPNRVPLAQVNLDTTEVDYLHADQNGSVVAITDSSGALDGQMNYTAYGKRLGSIASRFGFAGEWTDNSSGFIFLRARWYDPATASFLSEDPDVQKTKESYGYAGGNPLIRTDPTGLNWINNAFNIINDTVSNINSTLKKASDDETLATIGTVFGTAATVAAIGVLFVATGGIAGIALAGIAVVGTGIAVSAGVTDTFYKCSTKIDEKCIATGITTALTAIPLTPPINNLGKLATRNLPKHATLLETVGQNADRMNAKMAYGTINALGTASDFTNRGRDSLTEKEEKNVC